MNVTLTSNICAVIDTQYTVLQHAVRGFKQSISESDRSQVTILTPGFWIGSSTSVQKCSELNSEVRSKKM